MVSALLVEDNETFRKTLKSLLASRFPSMTLHEAEDGEEALLKVQELAPSLIFMDIKLPGQNGLQVTRKIRDSGCQATIIILTSYDIPEYRESAVESGADHFLAKNSSKAEDILNLVQSSLPEHTNTTG
jgi:CheY-like chemotaxis protein